LLALVWINIFLGLSVGYACYNDPAAVGRAIEQITHAVTGTIASRLNLRMTP
jgi:hypothetical protein